MEKGLPQKVTVSFRTRNADVYDLITHQRLKTIDKNGQTFVGINLKPAWGAILAVYSQAISNIYIALPEQLNAGKDAIFTIKVIGKNGKSMSGIQPLKLTIIDPKGQRSKYSGYYAANNGICKVKFVPAQNDTNGKWTIFVEELSSSIQSSKEFVYKKGL
jgi:hypothetical protein